MIVKKPAFFAILFVIAILVVIVYSTMNMARYRVEVCMQFNGRTNCKTTAGQTEEYALRTAKANACADIASGVTDSIACEHGDPVSLKWLK
jgi:hypothetical protein